MQKQKQAFLGCSTIIIIVISLFVWLYFFACEKKEEVLKVDTATRNTISNGIINYHLKNSNYIVYMRLNRMKITNVVGAFSIQKDEYSVPEKKDGYDVAFNFQINNPYDKQLLVPIPQRFNVMVEDNNENFATNTYLPKWQKYYEIGSDVTDTVGNNVVYVYDKQNENGLYRDYKLLFQPKETKEFKIKFGTISRKYKRLILTGFDLTYYNPKDTLNDGVGIIIDIDKQTIEGTINIDNKNN